MVPCAVCAYISRLFCLIPTSFCLCPQLFFLLLFISSYFQIFMKDGGRKEVCFQCLKLGLWPLLSQSPVVTCTPSLGHGSSTPCSASLPPRRSSALGAHSGPFFHLNSSIRCLLPQQLEFFHLCGSQ